MKEANIPFQIADLIHKDLKTELAPKEKELLIKWIGKSPENKMLYEKIIKSGELVDRIKKYDQIDEKQAWKEFEVNKIKTVQKRILPSMLRYAAIALLLVACYLLYKEYQQVKETQYKTLITPRGEESKVILADGTSIWLSAGSKLKYPVPFSDTIRQVFLEGEAFFDVNHTGKQFVVNTQDLKIEVLGTRFNVKSYKEEEDIKITLVEGRVIVASKNKSLALEPNQQAIWNNGELTALNVNTGLYTSWMNGKFVFDNQKLDCVIRDLTRWYNMNFEFETDELKNIQITGQIKRFDDVTNVLNMIEMTSHVRFEKRSDIILIKKDEK